MSSSSNAAKAQVSKTAMQKILDTVERVGNSVQCASRERGLRRAGACSQHATSSYKIRA
jgi:hypothetical protein